MTLVKICGLKDLETARSALEAGADMLGFVFAPSRRRVDPATVLEIVRGCRRSYRSGWAAVGVFAGQPLSLVREITAFCDLNAVQLSGDEPLEYCRALPGPIFRTVHMAPADAACRTGVAHLAMSSSLRALHQANIRLLLDTGSASQWGGTGRVFEWEAVGDVARDCVIAGGLTPSNVGEAIRTLHPWAVDVSSGVEVDGQKDPWLIRRFISEVRRSDDNES